MRRVSGQFSFVRDPETGRFDYPPDVKEGYSVLLKVRVVVVVVVAFCFCLL